MGDRESIEVLLARLEERQAANTAKLDEILKVVSSQSRRITVLEQWRWMLMGGSAGVGALVTLGIKYIAKL